MPALLLATASAEVNVPLAMLIVFGIAKLFAEIAERLRQPAIVGEILAGVLVGPSVLGWVQPNEVLTALSELGVLFLLFGVGLEVKTSELLRVGGTALGVATLGVVAPLSLGYGIMALRGAPMVEAVFVGAAMVATSVGITAQVLAAKGILSHRASQIILAAAIIDDVLGLIVLAGVSSLAKGSVNVVELGLTAAAAIAFTLAVAFFGTRAITNLMPRMQSKLQTGEVQFNISMIVLFGLAALAMYAGVAAIIGAFLAGMALSESIEPRVHDLAQGVSELLIPFFLAGIGLQLDLAVFAHAETIVLCALILIAALVSKLAGCGLAAIRLGVKDATRIGIGMMPRGEVGIVVAQIGLGLGVIPAPIYGVVVFMAVATTIIAPPLLELSFRGVQPVDPSERFSLG